MHTYFVAHERNPLSDGRSDRLRDRPEPDHRSVVKLIDFRFADLYRSRRAMT